MDVGEWLKRLGLERYETTFRENAVDAEVLPTLTADDLKEMGVIPIGHRRRLLEAITALRPKSVPDEAPAQVSSSPVPADASERSDASETTAERRPLSVMFCDLIGSTVLSARLDPEDLREVIRSYQARVAATIQPFNGFIARYVGDGVLIYFGWPEAHETDAARAVLAGLTVAAAISEAPMAGQTLQVRIGIATGLVVVGEPIGSGDSRQQTAVGETPNRAARLQSLARPGQVVIDAATRQQIGRLFECQELGTVALKGLPEPAPVWQVVAENRALGQFEALRSGLTPLVGRAEEIELLLRRWTQAKAGSGMVVLISAEPGVGKSRLAEVLAERIAAEPHIRLRYFCSPHHQDSALYPVIAQMERAASFAYGDEPAAKLAKLQTLLAATEPLPEDVALLAELHGLPSADLAPLKDLTPQRRKEKTFEALLRQVEGLARQQPVLIVFDDLHWIDPSSRELLDRVIEWIADWPVLLLALFRPEFQLPWAGQPHVTMLTLARLDRSDTAAMVANVAGGAALSPEIVAEIVERTDGVPLFVEELTKAVLETGERDATHALSRISSAALAIPATLHASLIARLDRLGLTAKEVAQIGAVIGRAFAYELVRAVAHRTEMELRDALDRLAQAELIFQRGAPPQASYMFKHALVQDAAYSTLLKSTRRALHGRIVTALEEGLPEAADEQPNLLAHHCEQAGLVEKAIAYYYKAARQALTRSALPEAIAQLTQGLALVAALPDSPERSRQELDLQIALGRAFVARKGYAAPEVGQTYDRARELCRRVPQTPQFWSVLWGLFVHHLHRSPLSFSREIGEELMRLAERQEDDTALIMAHRLLGTNFMFGGQLQSALTHFERALTLYGPAYRPSPLFLQTSEVRTSCLGFSALTLLCLGYPDRGLTRSHEALVAADELRHAHTLSNILHLNCWFHQLLGNREIVREQAARQNSLAREHGFPVWVGSGMVFHGWALATQGEIAEGLAQMRQGLVQRNEYAAGAHQLQVAHFLGLLAEICTRTGDSVEALSLLNEAVARIARNEERWFEAELHRLRGEALLAVSREQAPEAEISFSLALALARDQGLRLWELRAATSLARLRRAQGRVAEARDLLAPIYNWFTEGFDTKDLQEAKVLLAELR